MVEAREDKPITTLRTTITNQEARSSSTHGARWTARSSARPEPGARAARCRARPLDDDVVLGERRRSTAPRGVGPREHRRRLVDHRRSARLRRRGARLGRPQRRGRRLSPDRHPRRRDGATWSGARPAGASSPAPVERDRSASSPGSFLAGRTPPVSCKLTSTSPPARARTALGILALEKTPVGRWRTSGHRARRSSTGTTVVHALRSRPLAGGSLCALAVRDGSIRSRGHLRTRTRPGGVFANRGVRLEPASATLGQRAGALRHVGVVPSLTGSSAWRGEPLRDPPRDRADEIVRSEWDDRAAGPSERICELTDERARAPRPSRALRALIELFADADGFVRSIRRAGPCTGTTSTPRLSTPSSRPRSRSTPTSASSRRRWRMQRASSGFTRTVATIWLLRDSGAARRRRAPRSSTVWRAGFGPPLSPRACS